MRTHEDFWSYWWDDALSDTEYAFWTGSVAPAGRMHFHDRDQLTFVLAGSRQFRLGARVVQVFAGECLRIPARMAHQSLPHSHPGTVCLNVYAQGEAGILPPAVNHVRSAEPILSDQPVADLSAAAGLTREGYTRWFKQHYGMPPHAYRLAQQLNEARLQLQSGEPIAGISVETGFADQSHFGRLFREAFGTTPKKYRNAFLRSQTFQTR